MSDSLQDRMRERVRDGMESMNRGYEAWLKQCDITYEPDAHYNVFGRRIPLREYQDAVRQEYSVRDIKLGEMYNMLIDNDWLSMRYSLLFTNKETGEESQEMTMEFVHFKDNPQPIGARVIEGWVGVVESTPRAST